MLNQRAEQCRRVEYHEYMRRHVTFEQFKEHEFERPFPLKKEPMLPPAFRDDLNELNAKIGISLMPRIPCSNHTMATFVKTGRKNRKARDLVRTMAQLHSGIQAFVMPIKNSFIFFLSICFLTSRLLSPILSLARDLTMSTLLPKVKSMAIL